MNVCWKLHGRAKDGVFLWETQPAPGWKADRATSLQSSLKWLMQRAAGAALHPFHSPGLEAIAKACMSWSKSYRPRLFPYTGSKHSGSDSPGAFWFLCRGEAQHETSFLSVSWIFIFSWLRDLLSLFFPPQQRETLLKVIKGKTSWCLLMCAASFPPHIAMYGRFLGGTPLGPCSCWGTSGRQRHSSCWRTGLGRPGLTAPHPFWVLW